MSQVKISGFSREEVRQLDRAAKRLGWSRSQWARLALIYVSKHSEVNLVAEHVRRPIPSPEPNGGVSGVFEAYDEAARRSPPLVSSFDPDKPET